MKRRIGILLYFSQGIGHSITTAIIHFIGATSALLGFYLIDLIFKQKRLLVDMRDNLNEI